MAGIDLTQSVDDLLSAGYRALAERAWEESRDAFRAAVVAGESAEALEGLAMAAWWLDEAALVFEARERGFRLYRERGDQIGAGRMAIWLGLDHYIYRGELAIASGWLQRAHRLLDGSEPCAEHGWLALWESHIALLEFNDVARARRASAETVALARRLGSIDLEMLALALEGLALVSQGQVDEGMRRLDESTAAALAGEMTDLDAIVTTCCYLIYACERVRDFERAAQWCEKAKTISSRRSYRSMFAYCRTHYAAVLIWRGEWGQAEAELTTATRELLAMRPGWAYEGIVRLGELRRRQGRLDEAAALFGRAPGHPHALLGLAELALDRDEATTAADLVERFLRRVPPDDLTERAAGLELAVRVRAALGLLDAALAALDELAAAARALGTGPLRGSVSLSRGVIAVAAGDLEGARRCFEDAVDLFGQHAAPYETAHARLALARVLIALGRHGAAAAEAGPALATFTRIGAACDAERAAALLHALAGAPVPDAAAPEAPHTLTRRECEVLRLLARGQSNGQIADELFISVRTVERHISTIYEKIGAEGTAARAIATAWAIERGLANNSP